MTFLFALGNIMACKCVFVWVSKVDIILQCILCAIAQIVNMNNSPGQWEHTPITLCIPLKASCFTSSICLSHVKCPADVGVKGTPTVHTVCTDWGLWNRMQKLIYTPVTFPGEREQTDTLTFHVLPASLTSTCVCCSLLRNSENSPTKGYSVTKDWVTNTVTIWLSQRELARKHKLYTAGPRNLTQAGTEKCYNDSEMMFWRDIKSCSIK